MTGTPASRPPGQRPRHRHPGTAARQAGLPGRLGHEPSLPGTGRPGQGALVLQHAPPPPGPQPESPTSPQTGTMTTRHRARHARCQPRHEPGTLMATVTPSTSTPRRRTLWTPSDDATPAPQSHPQRRGTAARPETPATYRKSLEEHESRTTRQPQPRQRNVRGKRDAMKERASAPGGCWKLRSIRLHQAREAHDDGSI